MESQESLNNVIIIASLIIFLFGMFQIGVAVFYHKYYINSKRLDTEKNFREKLDLEKLRLGVDVAKENARINRGNG